MTVNYHLSSSGYRLPPSSPPPLHRPQPIIKWTVSLLQCLPCVTANKWKAGRSAPGMTINSSFLKFFCKPPSLNLCHVGERAEREWVAVEWGVRCGETVWAQRGSPSSSTDPQLTPTDPQLTPSARPDTFHVHVLRIFSKTKKLKH